MTTQNRFKSWATWLAAAGALWLLLSAFGVPEMIGVTETLWNTILNALGTLLVAFGILNNPTDNKNF